MILRVFGAQYDSDLFLFEMALFEIIKGPIKNY